MARKFQITLDDTYYVCLDLEDESFPDHLEAAPFRSRHGQPVCPDAPDLSPWLRAPSEPGCLFRRSSAMLG